MTVGKLSTDQRPCIAQRPGETRNRLRDIGTKDHPARTTIHFNGVKKIRYLPGLRHDSFVTCLPKSVVPFPPASRTSSVCPPAPRRLTFEVFLFA